jgi:hypothetical protein
VIPYGVNPFEPDEWELEEMERERDAEDAERDAMLARDAWVDRYADSLWPEGAEA